MLAFLLAFSGSTKPRQAKTFAPLTAVTRFS
jgi:hypothetical protein